MGASLLLLSCGGDSGTDPTGGTDNSVASVSVSPPSMTILVGEEVQYTATAQDASGNPVSVAFNWSVLPSTVASVTTGGRVRGLEPGSANVTATVGNRMGNAQVTVEAPPPPEPPAAPSGLTAIASSSSTIDLMWQDNSDSETEFRIERSTDGSGPWAALAEVGANATSYADSGLGGGLRFFYRVAASNNGTVSDWSNTADATTLTETEGAVAAVESLIETVVPAPGTPLEERNLLQELNEFAATAVDFPGVDTVLVLERVLAAQVLLDDGTTQLFINNRPAGGDDPPAPGTEDNAVSKAIRARSPIGRVDGPPGSAKAVVTSHDGGAAVASEVAQALSDAGYEILPLGPSLSDMRQYKDLGVLHLDTHGVAYLRLHRNEDGSVDETPAFALQTSTTAGSDLSAYRSELQDGSLAIATSVDQNGNVQTKLAITEIFIANHWSFDDGVVMLHACHGGAGPFPTADGNGPVVDPSILRLTMLGAGARIVVAYDNLTWTSFARPTIMHFFDRLLGANSFEPEDPPLRPFDVGEVYADMQERGLLQFTRPNMVYLGVIPWGGNEVNVVFDRVPGRTTLAPSIKNIDVLDDAAEGTGRLTLNGLFGSQQGTVEVEGVPVSVESWSEETIVARAPYEAGGSAGKVVVKKPNDVESNEVPLTEWRGTVTVSTEVAGSLMSEATIDLRFRADVHRFRNALTDDPEHRQVTTYISPATNGANRGSGSYSQGGVTETWFGTYPLEILTKQQVDAGALPQIASFVGGKITLDPNAGKAEICLGVWGQVGIRVEGPDGTYETTGNATFLLPSLVDRMTGLLGCIDASLDDDSFVISGDERMKQDEDVKFRLHMTDFQPFEAPDENTAG